MFRYLQPSTRGTATRVSGVTPPSLIAFYWHFVRQTKGWFLAVFATSLAVALIDMVIPVFIGKLVALMEIADRHAAIAQYATMLIGMIVLILIIRPVVIFADVAIRQNV